MTKETTAGPGGQKPVEAIPVKAVEARMVDGVAGSPYPPPFNEPAAGRVKRILGDRFGLTQLGVNLTTLEPGSWASQRHWHSSEDEFFYILEGEVALVTEQGEQMLTPGMIVGFPAGLENGHHFINRSDKRVAILEIGARAARDEVEYSDIDMRKEAKDGTGVFMRKNGEPYR